MPLAILQRRSTVSGLTLTELLTVLAILCVLGILVLPVYQSQILSARRSLGRLELLKVVARQEQYFVNYLSYADSLTQLGFPANPYVLTDAGNVASAPVKHAIYRIGMAVTSHSYTATATPIESQSGDFACQILSIDSNGLRKSSGTGVTEDCW